MELNQSLVLQQPPPSGTGLCSPWLKGLTLLTVSLLHFSFCSLEGPVMWEYFLRFTVREIEAQNLEIVCSTVCYQDVIEPGLPSP